MNSSDSHVFLFSCFLWFVVKSSVVSLGKIFYSHCFQHSGIPGQRPLSCFVSDESVICIVICLNPLVSVQKVICLHFILDVFSMYYT